MRIAIDAMGGDNAPVSTIKGSVDALKLIKSDIVLIGRENIIKTELEKVTNDFSRIEIINAEEIITNEDKPVEAIKRKKDSSLVVACEGLRKGEFDALVSAGNTGALLAGGLLKVGRIKGIDRPALAPVYPTSKGFSILIDAGANVDCKARNLMEFGIMGSVYIERVLGVKSPRVGVVNIGAEKGKGNKLVNEAYALLEESNLNFIGNVEARELPDGACDVIVCDGFVGNVILKLSEGVAKTMSGMLKDAFYKSTLTKLGALLVKGELKTFKKRMDYTEYGGAPLLGVKKPVIKAHGSSNAKAFMNAIKYAEVYSENDVITGITEHLT